MHERQGELQLDQLFNICDITETDRSEVLTVEATLKEMKKLLLSPGIESDIGKHCNKCDKDDHECPAKAHCWSHIPEYSVFNISRISDKACDLYKQGIISIGDVTSTLTVSNFRISLICLWPAGW